MTLKEMQKDLLERLYENTITLLNKENIKDSKQQNWLLLQREVLKDACDIFSTALGKIKDDNKK